MGGKVQVQKLEVKAAEEVTTPAGKFAALRVEITPGRRRGRGGVVGGEGRAPPRAEVGDHAGVEPRRGEGVVRVD